MQLPRFRVLDNSAWSTIEQVCRAQGYERHVPPALLAALPLAGESVIIYSFDLHDPITLQALCTRCTAMVQLTDEEHLLATFDAPTSLVASLPEYH